MFAYSSGNGASYQVLISYGPNLIFFIRRTPGSNLSTGVSEEPPGVEGPGELEKSIRLGRGVDC